jgi:hypothetical protein
MEPTGHAMVGNKLKRYDIDAKYQTNNGNGWGCCLRRDEGCSSSAKLQTQMIVGGLGTI